MVAMGQGDTWTMAPKLTKKHHFSIILPKGKHEPCSRLLLTGCLLFGVGRGWCFAPSPTEFLFYFSFIIFINHFCVFTKQSGQNPIIKTYLEQRCRYSSGGCSPPPPNLVDERLKSEEKSTFSGILMVLRATFPVSASPQTCLEKQRLWSGGIG